MILKEFSRMLDINLSANTSTKAQVDELLKNAKKYDMKLVFAPKCYLPYMVKSLEGTMTGVGGGAGSVLGTDPIEVCCFIAQWGLDHGAAEIDMVMNISYLKSGMDKEVVEHIAAVRQVTQGHILKCIIETPLLDENEITRATHLAIEGGVDFVKSASGTTGSTTLHDIEVMAKETRGRVGIKAAGGIRTLETVEQMMQLGVTRFGIGYSSAMNLIQELEKI